MSLEQDFLDGLKAIIELRGEKNAPLSKKSGMGETGIKDFFRKGSVPKVTNAKAIADQLGVTIDDIFKASKGIQALKEPKQQTTNFPSIPRYDASLSAGTGVMNGEDIILDYIPFTPEFLKKRLGRSSTDGLISCYVDGESMSPTLDDGDLIIIDTKITDARTGIYAINYGEESYVKRVEKMMDGYNLNSDNSNYSAIKVTGENVDKLTIIGKVLWSGGII